VRGSHALRSALRRPRTLALARAGCLLSLMLALGAWRASRWFSCASLCLLAFALCSLAASETLLLLPHTGMQLERRLLWCARGLSQPRALCRSRAHTPGAA